MHRDLRLSAVIPCYNEEQGIQEVIRRMPKIVDEIVVVDNNCTDGTAAAARRLGAIVVEQKIPGYGAAYQAGLARAGGDLIVTMDGDGSYPPEEIPRLVEHLLEREWEFLSGCRFPLRDSSAMGLTNRVGNAILTAATALLFLKPIRDSQSGMWLFRRAAFERLKPASRGMAFSEEIKLEALLRGLRFGEAHIPYGTRIGEVKLRRWRDGFENLWFLVLKRVGLK
jgi:glycosyltransferase involved in cell wall biosynthesis